MNGGAAVWAAGDVAAALSAVVVAVSVQGSPRSMEAAVKRADVGSGDESVGREAPVWSRSLAEIGLTRVKRRTQQFRKCYAPDRHTPAFFTTSGLLFAEAGLARSWPANLPS